MLSIMVYGCSLKHPKIMYLPSEKRVFFKSYIGHGSLCRMGSVIVKADEIASAFESHLVYMPVL